MKTSNDIQIVVVENKKQLKEFIFLPASLHKDHKNWVPPIYSAEWKYYNPKKNPAFRYCDVELALCYSGNILSGRIMGIVNQRYNELKNEKIARFSFFESTNNPLVASSLLSHIENWARKKGMKKMLGPFGMCYHDPIGFIIEGTEYEPSISTYYNFDFIPSLLENSNYEKKYDLVAYRINPEHDVPAFYKRIYDRVLSKGSVKLMRLKTKRELKKMVLPIFKLFNECYEEIDGYSLLDDTEMKYLAKQYIPMMDPELIKLATVNDELAGFMLAMPNISKGLRESGGKLYPFGFLKILKAMKNAPQLDLLLGGIKKKYQGIGIDVMLGYDIIQSAKKKNFKIIDSHLEMEFNYKVRAEMEKLGGQAYKKYRLYQKEL